MKKIILLSFALFSLSLNAADIFIKTIEAKTGALIIKMSGDITVNPNLSVKDKLIEVIIPNSHVKAKIEKNTNEVQITATQFDRDSVKVVATLNNSMKGQEELVNITLKDSAIQINVPKLSVTKTTKVTNVSRSPSVVAEAPVKDLENEKLDENYLNKLEKEQTKIDVTKIENKTKQTDTDRVTVAQASVAKVATNSSSSTPKSSFSIASYIGKFVAFLSLMILGFYGVLTLFKKGVIKKGRLGFLQSTKLVEVLSTTHVAPKRSLMMVKAHKQVFLISNSETGMQLISEIQDVTGLIKTGELEITGSNFETNLVDAGKTEKEFKLKEVQKLEDDFFSDDGVAVDTAAAKSIAKAPVKDEVRLSDQIKSKLKNLKQLQ
jgi:flagellar biogenesis protein FliO